MPDKEPVAADCVKGLCFRWPVSTEAWETSFYCCSTWAAGMSPYTPEGEGYQNNLAYIPWITQWSTCVGLTGETMMPQKRMSWAEQLAGRGLSSFTQWELSITKSVIEREREKQSFDKSQTDKESATIQTTKPFRYSYSQHNRRIGTRQSVIRISRYASELVSVAMAIPESITGGMKKGNFKVQSGVICKLI